MSRVVLCGVLSVACLVGATGCGEPRRPDVIVVTVDTLRADHVGVYADGAETPRIDDLAREGTVFERCAAPMPLTRPAHFSMLTSLYPREHGVLNNAMVLPDEARSLAEILAEHGYRTGGFVGVRLLGPDSGAAQGFERFDQPEESRERRAETVVRRALDWLDRVGREQPRFLWVHVFDPHMPYAPPEPFFGGPEDGLREIGWDRLLEIAAANDGDVPAAVLEEGKRLYRGEVAYVDHWIGELVSGVAERRSLGDTLFVLTADHGECFENGIWFEHADCMWEGGLRIPLIVRYPRSFAAGERVAAQTSILDIAPTVLRAAGIAQPAGLAGRPLQDHASFENRRVLVQYPFFQPTAADRRPRRLEIVRSVAGEPTTPLRFDVEQVGVVGPSWKYLRSGEEAELYALAPAADERRNRIGTDPEVAAELRDELARQLERHPLNLIDPPEINEETRRLLEALGYL
jgi:arylsulfatase A-like enzyme